MESFGEKEDSPRPNWLWGIRQVLLNFELLEVSARIEEQRADFALQEVRLTEAAYINLRI